MIGPIIVIGCMLIILGLIVFAIIHAPRNIRTETEEPFGDNFDDNGIDSDILEEITEVSVGVWNDD